MTAGAPFPSHNNMVDQASQVDFLENDSTLNCNIFCSNLIVLGDTCDAATQISSIPTTKTKSTPSVMNKTADKNCGTDIEYASKYVGPDPIFSESNLKCNEGFHGFNSIKSDENMIDIAGVKLLAFNFLLGFIVDVKNEKLSKQDRLLLFLMKMKLGLTSAALGIIFGVHRTTASRQFKSILGILVRKCKNIIQWPSREVVRDLMPDSFKEKYGNCRIIIDCTEFPVEQPPQVNERVHFYSHYKKGFTLKVLVGCTPNGFISFISKTSGGRTSDAQITNRSGLLDLLEPGDMVLADKGFPGIKTKIDDSGNEVLLVMPPFLRAEYFTEKEVVETEEIASVRIHIERIMQRIKTHRILSKVTMKMLPYIDAIVLMAGILVNLQPPIIKTKKTGSSDACETS